MGLHECHDELELARVDNVCHDDLKFDEEVDNIDGLYGVLVLGEHAHVVLRALHGDLHVSHGGSDAPRGGPQDVLPACHGELRVSHDDLNAFRDDLDVSHGGLPAFDGGLHASHGGPNVPRDGLHVSHVEPSTFDGELSVSHGDLNASRGDLANHEDVVVIHDLLFHDVRGAQFHDEALHQMEPQKLADSVHQVHALDDVRQSILYDVHQYLTVR